MKKWIIAALLLVAAAVVLFFVLRPKTAAGDPEARIIAYLSENVRPGEPVFVTDLYNTVFTTPEEREALQRMYDAFSKFLLPPSKCISKASHWNSLCTRIPVSENIIDAVAVSL